MVIRITHKKVSEVIDSPDPTKVNASDWNDGHVVEGLVPEAPDSAGYLRKLGGWVKPAKVDVGLDQVDNTRDVDKPIGSATALALAGKEPTVAAGTFAQYLRGDKTWQTLDRAAVGLWNADNSADANKPVSGPQQQALNAKAPVNSPMFTGIAVVPAMGSTDSIGSATTRTGFEVRATSSSAAAALTFHRPGAFATHFGVDVDNKLKFGGWSQGNVANEVVHQGNLTSYVTAPLATKANDADVVKLNGNQDVYGEKIFRTRVALRSDENAPLSVDSYITQGGIPQSFSLSANDNGSVTRLSGQLMRFSYTRRGTAAVQAFDSLFVTTPVIESDAPFPLRIFTMEGPRVADGKTLGAYTALHIQAPSGAGTVTDKRAIVVEGGAGPVLISAGPDTARNDLLRIGGSVTMAGPLEIGVFTLATLPSATAFAKAYCTVSDAAGGPKHCFATGGAWKIANTSTTVS